LDGDGDLDVLTGELDGTFSYFENTGTATAPAFSSSVALSGLSDVGSYSTPTLGDLDGDGDLDVLTGEFAGEYDVVFSYFENTGTATAPAFAASTTLSGLSDVGFKSAPAFGDLDGDGDLDVVAEQYHDLIAYFENTGTLTSPAFAASTSISGNQISYDATPVLADLDGDGDLDVVKGGYPSGENFLANTGTAIAPAFGSGVAIAGISWGAYGAPAIGDLDGDGDLDILLGEADGTFTYYEHSGTAKRISEFSNSTTLTGLAGTTTRSIPSFGDFDDDGDMDMLVGGHDGIFRYFENTGTAIAPLFAASTTLSGLTDVGWYASPTIGDIDGDGDLDVLTGKYLAGLIGGVTYFRNTGTAIAPAFTTTTVLSGLASNIGDANFCPALGDLDSDGDLDILLAVADGYGNSRVFGFKYLENTGSAINPVFAASTTLSNISIVGTLSGGANTVVPNFGDVDKDGDLDLLVGGNDGTLAYFENTGTRVAPAFETSTSLSGLPDMGTYSAPAFVDIDADGDLDVASGDTVGNLTIFENTGSGTTPITFASSTTLSGFSDIGASSAPTFGDLDGDGDLDMLAGEGFGIFIYFENTGTSSAPSFAATRTLPGLDAYTDFTTPILGDVDGDGDLDLFTGERFNGLYYYENTGTSTSPSFAASTTLSGIPATYDYSAPTFGDIDGDGDLDLLSGRGDGNFDFFQNTGSASAPAFGPKATLSGLTAIGQNSKPTFGDVDGDGDLDILAGNSDGIFFYFENTGTSTNPLFAASTTLPDISSVGYEPAPAFVDLDGDGDLDVVSGAWSGNFHYFKNVTRFTLPSISEGDRVVVPISKNSAPTSFALDLNATDDLDHDLTWSVRLAAGDGTALASGSGTPKAITYTPDTDFTGTDVFIVEVANEHGTVDSATIVVRIFDPANAIPLRDNFVSLDTSVNNSLSYAEALVQIPGMTRVEFDLLDSDSNGELSLNELLAATVGTGSQTPVYVNFSNAGSEDGAAPATGFNTLLEGASFVSNGGTVIISTGTTSETIYIPKAMTLQASGGTATIGAP
jgi:hypothetical protein